MALPAWMLDSSLHSDDPAALFLLWELFQLVLFLYDSLVPEGSTFALPTQVLSYETLCQVHKVATEFYFKMSLLFWLHKQIKKISYDIKMIVLEIITTIFFLPFGEFLTFFHGVHTEVKTYRYLSYKI